MNDDTLKQILQRVGKSAFVRHFEEIKAGSNNGLRKSYPTSAILRYTYSKQIFDNGRAKDALRIVASSARLDESDRRLARDLLKKYASIEF